MQTATQPQTKVVDTLTIGGTGNKAIKTAEDVVKVLGRPLGSPINGKEVGATFQVTLTGKIEIREFNGQKGAYFTTNEGYSIRVNASFNPQLHKKDATLTAICRELSIEGQAPRKFCAFVD
jgi:hypothetical protein